MSSAPVDGLIVFPGTSQFLNPRLLQMVIDKYPLVLIDQNIQIIQQTSVGTDNALAVSQGLSYISSFRPSITVCSRSGAMPFSSTAPSPASR